MDWDLRVAVNVALPIFVISLRGWMTEHELGLKSWVICNWFFSTPVEQFPQHICSLFLFGSTITETPGENISAYEGQTEQRGKKREIWGEE